MEICPYCQTEFDARKHRHSFGLAEVFTPRMPYTRIAQEFTVRCPSCGITFISSTLRFLGIATYSQMPWLLGAFCGFLVLSAWLF